MDKHVETLLRCVFEEQIYVKVVSSRLVLSVQLYMISNERTDMTRKTIAIVAIPKDLSKLKRYLLFC